MKRILSEFLLFSMILALLMPSIVCSATEKHWYCKRNSEHKQPTVDTDIAYIENLGGIYVDKSHGDDSAEKVIYLTFDAGYENGNIAKIMDVLKSEGVKGSFFILGNLIDKDPELVLRMANEGHSVCNHTLTHKKLIGVSEEAFNKELLALEEAYKKLTGRELSKLFRPPEGTFDEEMLNRASTLGYKTVFWSFAYADWDNEKQPAREEALKKILDNVHNGEIMLLHPTSKTNAEIMTELIQALKSQGYRFATLDEL